ncbi:LytR C-terminal domain-containing protein [Pseudarthrobacter sp. J1738]|uniref:LytR C-terminal domain-containing protein n=1 Tax=unclassified Pseudarthrobacter TaxID=2647000 RepID=UPI003D2AE24F
MPEFWSSMAKDPSHLHGHRVISGNDLRETFVPDDEAEENPGRYRRRLVHGIVLTLLVGLVVAAIVGALAIMKGYIAFPSSTPSPTFSSACPATKFDYQPNDKIKVNVYNSTNIPGLASKVAAELRARKYKLGEVGNKAINYQGTAVVVSGATGQLGAFNVQRNTPGSDYVQDNRTDASVDLIVSTNFKALTKTELVDQTPGALQCPREERRVSNGTPVATIPATPAAKK